MKSVVGFTTNDTMKLRGRIRDRTVVVRIDYRATRNFIDQSLIIELGDRNTLVTHYRRLTKGRAE